MRRYGRRGRGRGHPLGLRRRLAVARWGPHSPRLQRRRRGHAPVSARSGRGPDSGRRPGGRRGRAVGPGRQPWNHPGYPQQLRPVERLPNSLRRCGTARRPRQWVGAQSHLQNHIKYDAFGKFTAETNAAIDLIYGYTGRERDEETGIIHYRARTYDPAVGRFLQEDPLGLAPDTNPNRYVRNTPTNLTDPSGLDPADYQACTRCHAKNNGGMGARVHPFGPLRQPLVDANGHIHPDRQHEADLMHDVSMLSLNLTLLAYGGIGGASAGAGASTTINVARPTLVMSGSGTLSVGYAVKQENGTSRILTDMGPNDSLPACRELSGPLRRV